MHSPDALILFRTPLHKVLQVRMNMASFFSLYRSVANPLACLLVLLTTMRWWIVAAVLAPLSVVRAQVTVCLATYGGPAVR